MQETTVWVIMALTDLDLVSLEPHPCQPCFFFFFPNILPCRRIEFRLKPPSLLSASLLASFSSSHSVRLKKSPADAWETGWQFLCCWQKNKAFIVKKNPKKTRLFPVALPTRNAQTDRVERKQRVLHRVHCCLTFFLQTCQPKRFSWAQGKNAYIVCLSK